MWRREPWVVQPWRIIEPKVEVGVSGVAGLGLFTTCDIIDTEIVCTYSGVMRKSVHGIRNNPFLLEVLYWNSETNTHDLWYLDASDPERNTAGRWINDACTYTEKEWPNMPHSLETPYTNNCEYELICSTEPHETVDLYYVNVIATEDIPKGVELFAEYGVPYWKDFTHYFKQLDPFILTGKTYNKYTSARNTKH